jgi:hypothetical protein
MQFSVFTAAFLALLGLGSAQLYGKTCTFVESINYYLAPRWLTFRCATDRDNGYQCSKLDLYKCIGNFEPLGRLGWL